MEGLFVLGDNDNSRSILVQPVDDPWPTLSSDALKIGTVIEEGVHQSLFLSPRSRMHHDTRRLVYDYQLIVFIDDVEWNIFRSKSS